MLLCDVVQCTSLVDEVFIHLMLHERDNTFLCSSLNNQPTSNAFPLAFFWILFFIFRIIWTKQFQNLHHNFPRPKVHLWMSSYAKQLGQNPNIFNEHSKGVVTVLPWARSIPWAVCHLLYSGRHWEGRCWLLFGLHGSQPVVKKKKKERNLFLIKLGRRS